jgi:Ca-activated chloride channel family protein
MRHAPVIAAQLLALVASACCGIWAHQHYFLAEPMGALFGIAPLLYALLRIGSRFLGTRPAGTLHVSEEPAQATWAKGALMESPYALRTLAMGLLATAMMQPQSTSSVEDLTREGIDIILSLDLSTSMLSKDFKPSRLGAAKAVAADFIESRPYDRIGIVAYESEAFTQVPLTTDKRALLNGLSELEPGLLGGATAIGMGLATAVNRIRKSEAKSKIIILLTDGVNNHGQIEPVDAAQLAHLHDIKVYTVGLGSIGKALSPVRKVEGGFQYDWMEVRIDEETLKEIAKTTGGRYFRATDKTKLDEVYHEIDEMEKTEFNVLRYHQRTEEYGSFAWVACLLLLTEFALRHLLIRTWE